MFFLTKSIDTFERLKPPLLFNIKRAKLHYDIESVKKAFPIYDPNATIIELISTEIVSLGCPMKFDLYPFDTQVEYAII